MRLKTDLWVAALIRRAASEGAFATVLRKGSEAAGAIFVTARGPDGRHDLYGPAPQALLDDGEVTDRTFELVGQDLAEDEIQSRLASEMRFDPDLWLVEVEDRERRAFISLVREN